MIESISGELVRLVADKRFALFGHSMWPGPDTHLTCPITTFVGRDDPDVSMEEAEAWVSHTTVQFRLHTYPGDHFFADSHYPLIAEELDIDHAPVDQVRESRDMSNVGTR